MLGQKKSVNGVWSNVVKIVPNLADFGSDLASLFKIQIGNSKDILFLLDDWQGCGNLA